MPSASVRTGYPDLVVSPRPEEEMHYRRLPVLHRDQTASTLSQRRPPLKASATQTGIWVSPECTRAQRPSSGCPTSPTLGTTRSRDEHGCPAGGKCWSTGRWEIPAAVLFTMRSLKHSSSGPARVISLTVEVVPDRCGHRSSLRPSTVSDSSRRRRPGH